MENREMEPEMERKLEPEMENRQIHKRVATVLIGFAKLTHDQQREFLTEVEKYIQQDRLREDLARNWVVMGPVDRGCPCCGR